MQSVNIQLAAIIENCASEIDWIDLALAERSWAAAVTLRSGHEERYKEALSAAMNLEDLLLDVGGGRMSRDLRDARQALVWERFNQRKG